MNIILVTFIGVSTIPLIIFLSTYGFHKCKKCGSWSTWRKVDYFYDDDPHHRFRVSFTECAMCRECGNEITTEQKTPR